MKEVFIALFVGTVLMLGAFSVFDMICEEAFEPEAADFVDTEDIGVPSERVSICGGGGDGGGGAPG
jgi:hypothetical protein